MAKMVEVTLGTLLRPSVGDLCGASFRLCDVIDPLLAAKASRSTARALGFLENGGVLLVLL